MLLNSLNSILGEQLGPHSLWSYPATDWLLCRWCTALKPWKPKRYGFGRITFLLESTINRMFLQESKPEPLVGSQKSSPGFKKISTRQGPCLPQNSKFERSWCVFQWLGWALRPYSDFFDIFCRWQVGCKCPSTGRLWTQLIADLNAPSCAFLWLWTWRQKPISTICRSCSLGFPMGPMGFSCLCSQKLEAKPSFHL